MSGSPTRQLSEGRPSIAIGIPSNCLEDPRSIYRVQFVPAGLLGNLNELEVVLLRGKNRLLRLIGD